MDISHALPAPSAPDIGSRVRGTGGYGVNRRPFDFIVNRLSFLVELITPVAGFPWHLYRI
jgi:hypothetical protein